MTRIVDQFLIKLILENDDNWKVWKYVDDAAGEDAAVVHLMEPIYGCEASDGRLYVNLYINLYINKMC